MNAPVSSTRVPEIALEQAIARARAAWPALPCSPAAFVDRLKVVTGDTEGIASLCVEDLWLACACVQGVAGAAEAFQARHVGDIRRGLGPDHGSDDGHVGDLLQDLLVGRSPQPGRLASYRGHGRLGRWVYIVARRRRADLLRTASRRADAPTVQAVAAAYGDPELAVMRGTTHRAVRSALERAAAALEPRERNILRYVYVHQLRIDEIAGMYRVSGSTIKRRLALLRARLAANVRDGLRLELGLDDHQIEREIAGLDSALHVTLSRIFDRVAGRGP